MPGWYAHLRLRHEVCCNFCKIFLLLKLILHVSMPACRWFYFSDKLKKNSYNWFNQCRSHDPDLVTKVAGHTSLGKAPSLDKAWIRWCWCQWVIVKAAQSMASHWSCQALPATDISAGSWICNPNIVTCGFRVRLDQKLCGFLPRPSAVAAPRTKRWKVSVNNALNKHEYWRSFCIWMVIPTS